MFYLLLFYLFYFQRAVDHDFSRHIYVQCVPKFGAKVLPRGRVCGRAVRGAVCGNQLGVCCLRCLRCFAKFHRAQRRHLRLLVLSQLRINQDTMINGLYASMSAKLMGEYLWTISCLFNMFKCPFSIVS